MTPAAFPSIGCVVMAAGSSTRFGENKLSKKLGGTTLIGRALEAVPNALFARLVVVTRYPEVEALAAEHGFEAIRNDHPDWGAGYTVGLGTRAVADCDGALFLVADQPLLTRTTVSRIVETWRRNMRCIVGAGCGSRRGNPNLFPRRFFPELMALTGDRGGSAVIARHEADYLMVQTQERELFDCDTPQALHQLRRL